MATAYHLSITYDALGRFDPEVNVLGTFVQHHVDLSTRLDHLDFPSGSGQVTNYAYFINSSDKRLNTARTGCWRWR